MSTWNIYKFNTGTLVFDADGTIPRPNTDLTIELISNQQKVQLDDGSYAYMTPEIKYSKQPIQLTWYMQDQDFKDQIEDYIVNDDYLKIVTHISGDLYTLIGRFTDWRPTWLVGQEPDRWDIEATFEVME